MILRELMYGYDSAEDFPDGPAHFVVEEYRGSWILSKLADLGMWIWNYERSHRKHIRTVNHASDALALKAHRWSAKQHIKERKTK